MLLADSPRRPAAKKGVASQTNDWMTREASFNTSIEYYHSHHHQHCHKFMKKKKEELRVGGGGRESSIDATGNSRPNPIPVCRSLFGWPGWPGRAGEREQLGGLEPAKQDFLFHEPL